MSRSLYNEIIKLNELISRDYEKFDEKKIKLAGKRLRSHLTKLRFHTEQLRREIIDEMNNMPVNKKKPRPIKDDLNDELIEIDDAAKLGNLTFHTT